MLRARGLKSALLAAVFAAGPGAAWPDTLPEALVLAYQNNPSLNAQRASVRSIDENVPQALAGYRPRVAVTATGGQQTVSTTTKVPTTPPTPAQYATSNGFNTPFSTSLTITQTLFNGFQTANRTRQAEAQVLSARAGLGVAEQNVLLNAVTAYMNVLRDAAIVAADHSLNLRQFRAALFRMSEGER
jgi:outer membrane protein